MYYVYIIRCIDNSLYTGVTNNITRRMREHFSQDKKCAKYTKSHKPVRIEVIWQCNEKALAYRLEYYLKRLKKHEKEELIITNQFGYKIREKINLQGLRRLDMI